MSILIRGEVPERLNGPVLKTGGRKSRGFESHPLRHALLSILAVAVLLVGCSLTARKFDLSFPAADNLAELPVVVTDETGLVGTIEIVRIDPPPVLPRGFVTIAGHPNAVAVHWVGGACEASVAITVSGSDQLTFAVAITAGPGACDAMGIQRAVRIDLGRPVDVSRTSVTFDP